MYIKIYVYIHIYTYNFSPAKVRLVESGSPSLQRLVMQILFSPLTLGLTRSFPAIAPSDNQFPATVPGNCMRAERHFPGLQVSPLMMSR